MKFTKITLENFHQYKGLNTIVLDTSSNKPVNIIVGENGAGKSNFFIAINWCLYGDINADINNSLLNEHDIGDKINLSVKIELEDNNAKPIIFTKSQTSVKTKSMKGDQPAEARVDNINYKVEYWDDGHQLKATELEYENFVNRILPKGLSRFFFIDGDNLLDLMKTMKKNDIKSHFNALTKIDDAEQVLKNLKNWKSKILEENLSRKKSADVTLYKKLRQQAYQDLNTFKQQKIDINLELKDLKPKRDALKKQVNLIQEGKKYQEEVDALNREIALLSEKLDNKIEKRRQDVISSFPSFLMHKPLNNFTKLVKEKRKNHELPPPLIKNTEVIERLLDESYIKLDNTKYADVKWKKGFNSKKFIQEVEKYNKEIEKKIDSNFIDRATDGASIASTLTEINKDEIVNEVKESIKDSLSIEKDIDVITKKRDKINEKLKGSLPSDKEALYRRWERTDEDVIERENEIIFLKGKIEKATIDYDVNNRNISKMETYAQTGIANEKRIDFITKAIEALETSIGILTVQSINNINGTFNDILKKTDLKNDFKKAIIHQDFSMEVINTANTNLLDPAPKGGSNGQKLNIGFAFMNALSEETDMNFPILIDSPYGKLSQKFRKMISENISTVFGNAQATLLFHGEEYSDVVIDSFKGKTSNNYCINVTERDKLNLVSSTFGDSNDFESDLIKIKKAV